MSSGNYTPYSPMHDNSPNSRRIPFRGDNQVRQQAQVQDTTIPDSNWTSPRAMTGNGYPRTNPNSQGWPSDELGLSMSDPILQPPTEHNLRTEKNSFSPPTSSNTLSPSPAIHQMQTETLSARSSKRHLRTPSNLDNLVQENAQLRQELEDLRAERDETQDACDNMLTELMTAQEQLQEAQTVIANKDTDLSALQGRLAAQSDGVLPRDEGRELRDLHLRCSRLQVEVDRKEKQLQQARMDTHDASGSRSPRSPRNREAIEAQERLMEAEQRVAQANRLYQDASVQADTYLKQIMDWKAAYDGLQESYNGLQRSHHELSQAAHDTRSRVDTQAAQQLQASRSALNDAQQMGDFWKQNSEKLSKKNKDVMDQLRNLQDAVDSKSREVDRQKSMIEALQVQMH